MPICAFLAAAPFAVGALADDELATQRGGFRLPSGIDIAMTIDTQTAVDGNVVLRTIFRADDGPGSLSVYVPRPGEVVMAPRQAATAGPGGANPTVSYDRLGGIQVSGARSAPAIGVSGATPGIQQGLERIAVGEGIATDTGRVTDRAQGALRVVELAGADLSVAHLSGGAFGSAIANTGNDRVIDTQTTVAIGLSGAGPDVLGSSMLRAMDVSADALRGRL